MQKEWNKNVEASNYLTTLSKIMVEPRDHMFHWTANEQS